MRHGLPIFAASLIALTGSMGCDQPQPRDPARSTRTWMLEAGGAALYDLKSGRRLLGVSLPDWHWAGEPYSCGPALAAGLGGEVVITSDVMPTLWRIDPVTSAVTVHEPILDADADKGIGLVGLVYSRPLSAYFGVTHHGSLWRIDPLLRRAQKVSLNAPLREACGIGLRRETGRLPAFCVLTADGTALVELSPDQRSAFVRLMQTCVLPTAASVGRRRRVDQRLTLPGDGPGIRDASVFARMQR